MATCVGSVRTLRPTVSKELTIHISSNASFFNLLSFNLSYDYDFNDSESQGAY